MGITPTSSTQEKRLKAKVSLAVVMPVYNEEACIQQVLETWISVLRREVKDDFLFLVYDDGSKDSSYQKIRETADTYPEIIAYTHPNIGHGPTLLKGYAEANTCAKWVLQIDSDDEIDPSDFQKFWQKRQDFDFIIGNRNRQSPKIREFITYISRQVIFSLFGSRVYDVNCPFRLFRASVFDQLIVQIPEDTFAPNLLISGYASHKQLRIFQIPITHNFRATGHVSIRRFKLLKVAVKAMIQTCRFAMQQRLQIRIPMVKAKANTYREA